jgi:hypothetical protein
MWKNRPLASCLRSLGQEIDYYHSWVVGRFIGYLTTLYNYGSCVWVQCTRNKWVECCRGLFEVIS